jgi:putative nucleotidyltransferase with HDIG domain
MRIGISFLQSRIARRFFLLFLCCAFLPTTLLVGLSYQRVKNQLIEQSWLRMEKDSKSYGMALMDRLLHADNLIQLYASYQANGSSSVPPPKSLRDQIATIFDGLALFRGEDRLETVSGQMDLEPDTDLFNRLMQEQGETTVYTRPNGSSGKVVYLLVPFTTGGTRGLFVAKPANYVIWGLGVNSMLPAMTELAVYDAQGQLITATFISPGPTLPATAHSAPAGNYLQFEYTSDDMQYLACGWSLFLKSHFNAQSWTIILSASRSDILKAMLEFKRSFPLIILLAFWVILFLSLFFIRKTLAPLAVLQQGTERVGAKDFTSRVEIDSGDEFEQLARSFNTMTRQLDKQFNTLALIDEIDRSILSSLDPSVIIPRSLRMISEFFSCKLIMLAQRSSDEQNHLRLSILKGSHRNDMVTEHIQLSDEEKNLLFTGEPFGILDGEHFLPDFLRDRSPGNSFLFLPLDTERQVRGALILDFPQPEGQDAAEEIRQARQLADQLAIALSNARLVADLERLSIGTVEALARTVDAKSKWTAGHSERVAELAVRIGRAMQCDDRLLELLFRGGLLHDIGKIGVPIAIIDKPGKLNEAEYDTIKTHPAIGAGILEPIQVYRDILPLIVQHHERYDGKGYPAGLVGEEIDRGARILSVADVYDALISQRPYRHGWVKENALAFIRENQGIMFDPKVVDVFLAMES